MGPRRPPKEFVENESNRKIFIGGLNLSTTDEGLRDYYSQWGEIIDFVVMKDSYTKKSRGFGFITFKDEESVEKAMSARPHRIDDRDVDPKRAVPRGEADKNELFVSSSKIYITGVKDPSISEEDLKNYFSSYGTVTDAEIKYDDSGNRRGFAFVQFDDYDAVDKVVLHKNHEVNGHRLNVTKALSKEERNKVMAKAGTQSRYQGYNNYNSGGPPDHYNQPFNNNNFFDGPNGGGPGGGFDFNSLQSMMFGSNGFMQQIAAAAAACNPNAMMQGFGGPPGGGMMGNGSAGGVGNFGNPAFSLNGGGFNGGAGSDFGGSPGFFGGADTSFNMSGDFGGGNNWGSGGGGGGPIRNRGGGKSGGRGGGTPYHNFGGNRRGGGNRGR